MKVLITGGGGFIGSHLTKALLERNDEVIVYTKDNTQINEMKISDKNLVIVKGDVTNSEALVRTVLEYRPNFIVHLAAITGIKRCLDLPRECFYVNVYGTFNVVMAALKIDAKLIFASSREVYGETIGETSSEDDPLLPNNLYGLTKLLAEEIIIWAGKKYGLNYTILRLTNVYGPGGDKYGLQKIIQKVLKGEKIQILGGDQIMNFVYVNDVVRAILLTLENKKSTKEIFNIGSYNNIKINDLVLKIIKLIGRNVEIERAPYRETETMFFRPDLSKITKILGWMPQIDIDTGLLYTIEWYRTHLTNNET
jgi:UDP-glucose 4-epimerase